MERELTELQRKAMSALQAARTAGVGLSAYARANGMNVRQLHDAVTGLRSKRLPKSPLSAPAWWNDAFQVKR